MDVLGTFVKTVRRFELIRPGDRILAAVSGGADSVALFHLLDRWEGPAFELAVAHLDHGQRGPDGRRDADFVDSLARRAGVECLRDTADRPDPADPLSEDAMRGLRLSFLEKAAARWRATVVALGHHRDDRAETLVLHLLRGAGGSGLGGMPPVSDLSLSGARLIRPLIALPRQALRQWLVEQDLPWCEDTSNEDGRFLRNRVRKDVMPLLEELRPGASAAIARTAALLRDDDRLLSSLAADDNGARLEGAGSVLAIAELRDRPPALARRVLRRAAARAAAEATPASGPPGRHAWAPGAEQVEAVLEHVRRRRPGRIDLGRGWIAAVDRETVCIRRESKNEP